MESSDNDMEILELLLLAGADVNMKTAVGTALDRAVRTGQMRTIRVLLDKGADENLMSDSGQYHMERMLRLGY